MNFRTFVSPSYLTAGESSACFLFINLYLVPLPCAWTGDLWTVTVPLHWGAVVSAMSGPEKHIARPLES